MQNKIIHGTNEQIAYFEELDGKMLHEWTKKYLSTGEYYPLDIYSDNRTETLVGLFYRSKDEEFRHRYRRVVSELVNEWSEKNDSLDYFSRLVILSGRVGAISAYECLLNHAKNGHLKGKKGESMDIHQIIVRVIWGMTERVNRLSKSLFEDNIKDTNYEKLSSDAIREICC